MAEEAKQEPPKAESKAEENPPEKSPVEEKKEPDPPSPCVLLVDLHCVGCAKKIKKFILKMKGVEGVLVDMAKSEVTIKGKVEPQSICNIITKKTKKIAKVISPLPEAKVEPIPEAVTPQAIEPVTVELNINMHCKACAEQLKRKILKMRGVQTAETELSTGKVIVTGTMDANKLADYVYRRTKKQVKIVPQPEPEQEENKENPVPEEGKPEQEKEENQELEKEAKPEQEKVENVEKKQDEKPAEEPKKEEGGEGGNDEKENKEEKGVEEEAKKEVGGDENEVILNIDDETMKRMMYYYYQPLYVNERIPPPQLFSDENPNACCIL